MYMYAPTGIADALGQPTKPALSPELRTWLKRVRAQPGDFEMLLATAALHPKPTESRIWGRHNFSIGEKRQTLIDEILLCGSAGNRHRGPAASGSAPTSRSGIRRLATHDRGRGQAPGRVHGRPVGHGATPQSTGVLPPFDVVPAQQGAGRPGSWLGWGTASRRRSSRPSSPSGCSRPRANEAHYYMVGRWLQRYAEVLQTKDPVFKREVDEKMALIKQIEKEKQQKQRQKP